ncbi:MAG: hypothetical protein PHH00_01625 [Candidatus Nanoarchaeia archaeon]|nr:hypothetical protein [Candidatus Nanoarchaeia archaeon]
MAGLVRLTGDFSIDEMDRVLLNVRTLANQPPFEVQAIYAGRNPRFSYKEVWVDNSSGEEVYHVTDKGHADGWESELVGLNYQGYRREEVEKLRGQ